MSSDNFRMLRRGLGLAAVSALGLVLGIGCAATPEERKRSKLPEDANTSADKHYKVAVASFHEGLFSDAKMQLERALESNPEHGDSLYLRGLISLNEGRTMVESVEQSMCLTDEAANVQRGRADELHRTARDNFESATKAYEEGTPGQGRAFNSLAVVSLYFRDVKRAQDEARNALGAQFYTERYSALSNLGWAYYQHGDLVEAMAELRQAILLNPDYCVGRYRLAQVYLDFNLSAEALDEVTKVTDNPRCPIQDAHRLEGVARMRLGQQGEAREAFDTCVALAPRSCLARECADFLEVSAADAQGSSPRLSQR